MELLRKANVWKPVEYKLGDTLEFEMNGKTVEAFAVKQEEDGMIFLFRNCLDREYQMDEVEGVFKSLVDKIPEELKEMLIPFESGEFFRLPTEKEIFDVNNFGVPENTSISQWECMKKRCNRISFSETDSLEWYWLNTKSPSSNTNFVFVDIYGGAFCLEDNYPRGIRPVLKI